MRLPEFLTHARAEARHMELVENEARLAALVLNLNERLAALTASVRESYRTLPHLVAREVLEAGTADVLARAAIKADTEAQPLSIEAADKARVRAARERERETR